MAIDQVELFSRYSEIKAEVEWLLLAMRKGLVLPLKLEKRMINVNRVRDELKWRKEDM